MPRHRFNAPGPGRPKGRKNDRTLLVGALLDELVPDERLIRLLIELAEGRKRKVLDRRGRLVTVQDRGDGHVAVWLGDRKWGRMPQPVANGGDSPPVRVLVLDDRLGIKYRNDEVPGGPIKGAAKPRKHRSEVTE